MSIVPTTIRLIRPGERIQYRIVRREGSPVLYRIQWRNADTVAILRRYWWQLWRRRSSWQWLKRPGIYTMEVQTYSSCHAAEADIDTDVRERIGRAEGWIPVSCSDEGNR